MDFNSLLKLANEKKDIPVKIETKVEKKDGEFGDRPMTKKEKALLEALYSFYSWNQDWDGLEMEETL